MQKTKNSLPTLSELDRDQLIARIHALEKKLEFKTQWLKTTDENGTFWMERLDLYYTKALAYQDVIYVLCPGKAEQVIQHADTKARQQYLLLKQAAMGDPPYETPPTVHH